MWWQQSMSNIRMCSTHSSHKPAIAHLLCSCVVLLQAQPPGLVLLQHMLLPDAVRAAAASAGLPPGSPFPIQDRHAVMVFGRFGSAAAPPRSPPLTPVSFGARDGGVVLNSGPPTLCFKTAVWVGPNRTSANGTRPNGVQVVGNGNSSFWAWEGGPAWLGLGLETQPLLDRLPGSFISFNNLVGAHVSSSYMLQNSV